MKFIEPEKKMKLFKTLTKGDCFRFADTQKHGHGVHMKIWNSTVGSIVGSSLDYCVDIEKGHVGFVTGYEKVFVVNIEAREVPSAA